ncbi:MAG: glycosyltransferase, partial [Tepidiformaceae bacterium]
MALAEAPLRPDTPARLVETRVECAGKFLSVGGEKLYLKGVTYGTFATDDDGTEILDRTTVASDFASIRAAGFNTVRVYTTPRRWLLDEAAANGLYVLAGLPWEQHIAFLDDRRRSRDIVTRVKDAAAACAGHPALLGFAVGNEIPAPIVRWHGARKVERFIHRLYRAVKEVDPDALVTYVNYPSTEYLSLPFLDFVAFNVYLEDRDRLEAYLARLQNIAGDRPLVLAEIGLDSRRNGESAQAESLRWQLESAYGAGCAGAFVFSWTDEWHRGGMEITDWDFGLVTRDRRPKRALEAIAGQLATVPYARTTWPMVSVVVCTYNGARTIRDCMEGLAQLEYPNFEIIVVDDGCTDATRDIVGEYDVRLISTENRGLGSARNTGMEAARGDYIAYTDDDARPDPHWLHFLVTTFERGGYAVVGGPNIAPPGDGPIAQAVYHSPGGPIHVLRTDTDAEHVPGCNLAFRTDALRAIGGFDPIYRAAGDDVDVCWRIEEAGGTIGFSPGAMVWHHRRNSARAYWRQQQGYGKAEALLEQKWPERYNAPGHLRWGGQLYGHGVTRPLGLGKALIYGGTYGSAPFQSVYQPGPRVWNALPLMPEWFLVCAALLAAGLLGFDWAPLLVLIPIALAGLLVPVAQAFLAARRAVITPDESHGWSRARIRALVMWFHLVQPAARLKGRLAHGLTPWRRRGHSR